MITINELNSLVKMCSTTLKEKIELFAKSTAGPKIKPLVTLNSNGGKNVTVFCLQISCPSFCKCLSKIRRNSPIDCDFIALIHTQLYKTYSKRVLASTFLWFSYYLLSLWLYILITWIYINERVSIVLAWREDWSYRGLEGSVFWAL